MRRTKTKKRMSLLLSLIMVLSMMVSMPMTASADVGMQDGEGTLTVNQSKVAFAGHEWWVIGDASNGVKAPTGNITLLAANLDNDFKNVPFRKGQGSAGDGFTEYTDGGWTYYYANNPSGMNAWTTPNEYAGSTLQQKMVTLASSISADEQKLITARNLTGGGTYQTPSTDGIAGPGVSSQKLWALSEAEWTTIGNNTVRSYDSWWWLRSPDSIYGYYARIGNNDGANVFYLNVDYGIYAARPALNFNLASVIFSSAASSASGKSSATVGSGLVGASAPSGTVKFTVKDTDKQKLTVNATCAQSTQANKDNLEFSYADATTGTNQYVSCIMTNSQGAVKYYGKLADSSNAASGNLSIPMANIANGTYTLKIFSEEANGDMYTDFCSEPVEMTVTVSNGKGTVSNYGGTASTHDWQFDAITFSDDGKTAKGKWICKNDNTHIEEVDATVTSKKTKEPTCEGKGETTYTASATFNGETKTDTKAVADISATGHKYGDWKTTTEPTGTSKGVKERTCSVCSDVEKADVEKLPLKFTEGMNGKWTNGNEGTLNFKTNGDYDMLEGIYVDGDKLDSSQVETASGSTVIKLKDNYLNTLSAGTYTLTAKYTGDQSTDTKFTVASAPKKDDNNGTKKTDNKKTAPATGDSTNVTLWIAIMLASLFGVSGAVVVRRRSKN